LKSRAKISLKTLYLLFASRYLNPRDCDWAWRALLSLELRGRRKHTGCADMRTSSFALVTGASQGLGRVFAHALAARKQNVILVARSRDKLEDLAGELRRAQSVAAEVLEFDLASSSAGPRLAQQLRDRNLPVNLLVNNAGFGVRGAFRSLALHRQMEMLTLNNAAIVELTYLLLPLLMEHPQAGIINVSSSAGFQPIPYASLYAATKSFLTSFSLGLQEELRSCRVSVVTLCPGRILADGHPGEAKNGDRKFGFIYQSPEDVVQEALDSLANGGGLVVPGFVNKLSVFAQRLIPRRAVPALVARISRQ
jgi:short-subunit dehydrogenase